MAPFHLGWFLANGFGVQGWGDPSFPAQYDWTRPEIYQDSARALERACFDLLIIEDTSAIPDNYGASMEIYLKHAIMAPKMDPAVLVPYIAQATTRLGIAPTLTSTFYPPFLLARLLATLDHTTGGRVGWNMVTAGTDQAAQNYGHERQYEHDLRYDMADEYIDLAKALWASWDADAVVRDEATGVFADAAKVHRLDFQGRFYRSRGPLNVPRPPQGHPVLVAPGGSGRGRRFAGRNAEIALAGGTTVEAMKQYRDDVRRHAAECGRDPDGCKVMFAISPVIVADATAAQAYQREAKALAEQRMEGALAAMSYLTQHDLKTFDLDAPLPEIRTNAMQTLLQRFKAAGPDATLRTIATGTDPLSYSIVGTADAVAEEMGAMIETIGGDGFLITALQFEPAYVASITDELVPALQRRGLTRTDYAGPTLRENLFAF